MRRGSVPSAHPAPNSPTCEANLALLKTEARRRYDAKVSAGAAAADIRLGKYDNWIGPERIVMDVQRFYDEFAGTLTPEGNVSGIRDATNAYNAIRARG
jgi:hypothetical protein